jgi:cytochrome P450
MLRLLAEHPEAMKRAREEILRHFGANGDPAYQDLENLDYLNAVVLETLRLYPSAAFTRTCDHDVVLQGGKYIIPAGTQILIVPFIVHRDERYWERPDEFLPERFLNEELDRLSNDARGNSLQSRIGRICAKKAYLPFSLGPRNCVGRPLACKPHPLSIFLTMQC